MTARENKTKERLANRQEQFASRLQDIYTGSILTQLIEIGHRTGLLEAATQRSGTSHQISARAGLNERYVREWLGAMASVGIVRYEAETKA